MVEYLPCPERRVASRVAVDRPVVVSLGSSEHAARTVNVSTSGMLVALAGELAIWAEVLVEMPELGPRAARVARQDGVYYGLVFREPLSAEEFAGLTGVACPADDAATRVLVPAKRPARTAPHAFGRDRLKTFRRQVAEGSRPDRA